MFVLGLPPGKRSILPSCSALSTALPGKNALSTAAIAANRRAVFLPGLLKRRLLRAAASSRLSKTASCVPSDYCQRWPTRPGPPSADYHAPGLNAGAAADDLRGWRAFFRRLNALSIIAGASQSNPRPPWNLRRRAPFLGGGHSGRALPAPARTGAL